MRPPNRSVIKSYVFQYRSNNDPCETAFQDERISVYVLIAAVACAIVGRRQDLFPPFHWTAPVDHADPS